MYHGNLFAALAHRMTPGSGSRALFWNLRASNMDAKRYHWIVRLSSYLSGWPNVVIANSESGAAFHKAQGYRARRMVVIETASTPRDFARTRLNAAARRKLGISTDAPVVIHIARVDPMKDHQTFLKAMAKVPSVTALMVGAVRTDLKHPRT